MAGCSPSLHLAAHQSSALSAITHLMMKHWTPGPGASASLEFWSTAVAALRRCGPRPESASGCWPLAPTLSPVQRSRLTFDPTFHERGAGSCSPTHMPLDKCHSRGQPHEWFDPPRVSPDTLALGSTKRPRKGDPSLLHCHSSANISPTLTRGNAR